VRSSAAWSALRQRARTVAAQPSGWYRGFYERHGLHRRLWRAGLGPAMQIALLPRLLPATAAPLVQPYLVDARRIRWGGRPPGGEQRVGNGHGQGVVFSGDWDIADRRPLEDYLASYTYSRCVLEIFRDGRPHRQTQQYEKMMACVRSGRTDLWQARGCRTPQEVEGYFHAMADTFDKIRREGYRTQAALGSPDPYDEIKVFVDRHGDLMKLQGGGHHRLAMVHILQISPLPVLVLGVHREYALRCAREHDTDVLSALHRGLQALAQPPQP
jgi:hypothetical protein